MATLFSSQVSPIPLSSACLTLQSISFNINSLASVSSLRACGFCRIPHYPENNCAALVITTCFFRIHTQEVCQPYYLILTKAVLYVALFIKLKKNCIPTVGSSKRRVMPWLWYIFLFLFSYVCAIHACVCYTCMRRPEVDVQSNLPLVLPHLLRRGLSIKSRAYHRGQLGNQKTPLSAYSGWHFRWRSMLTWFLFGFWGFELQSSHLHGKHFPLTDPCPRPGIRHILSVDRDLQ